MRRGSSLAGIGGVAFAVLTLVAFAIASPVGGDYSANDVADYVAKGHRTAVVIALYLFLIGVVGLVALLARLRQALTGPAASIFWGTGVAAAAAFAVGFAVVLAVPLAVMYGGTEVTPQAQLVYTLAEIGWVVMYGAAAITLGLALVLFALASPVGIPSWVRWATLAGGIAALASPAWFPFFLVLLWALVIGAWLIVAERRPAGVASTQAA